MAAKEPHWIDIQAVGPVLGSVVEDHRSRTKLHRDRSVARYQAVATRDTFDSSSNRTSHADENGNVTTYACDPTYQTFLFSTTLPPVAAGTLREVRAYHEGGKLGLLRSVSNLALITDTMPAGLTTYDYDAFGRTTVITRPLEGPNWTERYEYYDGGPLGSPFLIGAYWRLDANRTAAQRYFFDGFGRLVQHQLVQPELDGLDTTRDVVVDRAYDGLGRLTVETAPWITPTYQASSNQSPYARPITPPRQTATAYDVLGRVTVVTATTGATTRMSYTGWTREVVDGNSHKKGYEADAFGRLRQVVEYSGVSGSYQPYATTSYGYDVADRLTGITDTLGHTTAITYDALGRKTGLKDPDTGLWSYTYDAAGNLLTQTDARNTADTFAYDALHRLTTRSYPRCLWLPLTEATKDTDCSVGLPDGAGCLSCSALDQADEVPLRVCQHGDLDVGHYLRGRHDGLPAELRGPVECGLEVRDGDVEGDVSRAAFLGLADTAADARVLRGDEAVPKRGWLDSPVKELAVERLELGAVPTGDFKMNDRSSHPIPSRADRICTSRRAARGRLLGPPIGAGLYSGRRQAVKAHGAVARGVPSPICQEGVDY
ncbi:MAG: RHS repeat protein [Chloroflexi bacterium]|nr:RHS repeat protein [Chloroflexota bacterium]